MLIKGHLLLILTVLLSSIAQVVAGQPAMSEVGFFPQGQLVEIDGTARLNGKPYTGAGLEHYPNRQLARRVEFKNGLKEGETRSYSDTGKLTAIGRFYKGLRNGLQEVWFIEGPKQQEERYVNGTLDGIQTKWHLSGHIFRQENFKKGKLLSRKVFYPTEEVFSNYVNEDGRKYGIDSGELCFEPPRDGKN